MEPLKRGVGDLGSGVLTVCGRHMWRPRGVFPVQDATKVCSPCTAGWPGEQEDTGVPAPGAHNRSRASRLAFGISPGSVILDVQWRSISNGLGTHDDPLDDPGRNYSTHLTVGRLLSSMFSFREHAWSVPGLCFEILSSRRLNCPEGSM